MILGEPLKYRMEFRIHPSYEAKSRQTGLALSRSLGSGMIGGVVPSDQLTPRALFTSCFTIQDIGERHVTGLG
jgi:hypothetical protein